jgi:poly-gamma-glutamate synthesis protein (capsule biosynthesis protein)
MPLDAVDVRVRSLAVDGVNIVYDADDADTYPLVEHAWIVAREQDDAHLTTLLRETARDLALRLALPGPDPIILRATGDLGPVRCSYARQLAYGDFRHAFLAVGPWLAEADLTIGSFDATISDAGQPYGCIETLNLLAPPETVEGLVYAGLDLVTIAANHVKDCGQRGYCGNKPFFDTIENLRNANILPVGGGANLAEARRPGILTAKGIRFAFLGYDEIGWFNFAEPTLPGTAPLEADYLREDIAVAANQADVVVVLPQWGVEYVADPTLRQRSLARVAVEAGADLIVGNGAHWVQAAEVIDRAFVAYALGNFVYDQDWSIPTQQGAVLEAAFHGPTLKGIRYHPVRILDKHQPNFAGPAEARQIMQRIWNASAALD